MNKRYDFIRNMASDYSTNVSLDYFLIEDLEKIGGPVTKLRHYQGSFSLENPNELADKLEAFAKEAKENVDRLAAKYNLYNVISVE